MLPVIECQFRQYAAAQPVCRVVADLLDQPLPECHVNDSACAACLASRIAPQAPNPVVASMAIGTARRLADPALLHETINRFHDCLRHAGPPVTTCVLRGPEVRQVPCKPCQAGSLHTVNVAVYRCPRHSECTLHNTGQFPRIHACATCPDRLEQYYPLHANPIPPSVLAAIHNQSRRSSP